MRGEHQHLQWPFTGDIIIHCELVNLGKRQEPLLNYSIYDNFSWFFLSHSLLADRIRPMVDVFLVKRFLELYIPQVSGQTIPLRARGRGPGLLGVKGFQPRFGTAVFLLVQTMWSVIKIARDL